MKNPLKSDLSSNFGLLLARIPLGLYFALAGYAHFKTQNFEMAVGGLLLLGLTTRLGGMLAAGITALLIAGMGLSFETNPNSTQYQMLMMVGLSILMLCLGGGKFTLDNFLFNKKKQEAH